MTEYIEREAALEESVELYYWCGYEDRYGYFVPVDAIQRIPASDVSTVRHWQWKYFRKQNKAVCTNCSFERDLDANFGKAVACPNCGAYMPQPPKGE